MNRSVAEDNEVRCLLKTFNLPKKKKQKQKQKKRIVHAIAPYQNVTKWQTTKKIDKR